MWHVVLTESGDSALLTSSFEAAEECLAALRKDGLKACMSFKPIRLVPLEE